MIVLILSLIAADAAIWFGVFIYSGAVWAPGPIIAANVAISIFNLIGALCFAVAACINMMRN